MATSTQTYKTHAKFVPLYHYVTLPILLGNVLVAAYYAVRAPGLPAIWAVLMSVALFLGALFARVFALAAQDRVIRLEERMRMRELLPADMQARIPEFSRDQLIALRFASDAELPTLAATVLRDNIQKRDDIKKMVATWRADDHQL
ncbi:MAG TPA: DUF6526 family protein [Vicinamibacterales bacterium]|nr:DUF6526 family protein [Vicinamibacterales bacterium]